MEENEIIVKARNGDLEAFEDLVALYRKKVFSFALYHLRNRDDAEDAAQEVFWRVFNYIKKYDPSRKFFSWLYAIEMNVIRTLAKKRKNRGPSLDEMDTEGFLFRDDGLLSTDDKIALFHEIGKLNESDRNLLYYKYMDGLSTREIAAESGITEENVKVRLFRIRERMAKDLQNDKEATYAEQTAD
jgi:RNA polymerase sigma-70 factor (ECF subfamily)